MIINSLEKFFINTQFIMYELSLIREAGLTDVRSGIILTLIILIWIAFFVYKAYHYCKGLECC